MNETRIFQQNADKINELKIDEDYLEKDIHRLFENNLEELFGLKFIASKHSTGIHRGEIDTLAFDPKIQAPVIIEYKRKRDSNVINQSLSYLNWLLDHHADFYNLVNNALADEAPEEINFEEAYVICVARKFSKFDADAVVVMNRNIKLIQYKKFQNDILQIEFFDPLNIVRSSVIYGSSKKKKEKKGKTSSVNQNFIAQQPIDEEKARYDRVKRDFVDFIRLRGGAVEKTTIATNFKKFKDRREKQDVINDLLEGEILKEVKEKGNGHKAKTMYVLNKKHLKQ